MGNRRAGRENALRVLYVIDITGYGTEEALKLVSDDENISPDVKAFAGVLVKGTCANRKEIDGHISDYSQNWTIERMPSIDRNILRLATYELLQMPDTPVNVIINEAVEIAKIFSTLESGKFVNGILGSLLRDLASGEVGAAAAGPERPR